jgi:hypothetical protein
MVILRAAATIRLRMKIHFQGTRLGDLDPAGNPTNAASSGAACRSLSESQPMSESLTQKWLRQHLRPYPDRDRVFADVDALLARFPTLRPKSDVYSSVIPLLFLVFSLTRTPAYDDGRTQLLLCIHGLLPIVFHHTSYNIPIALWLTRQYPSQPPIVYVVPTNEMLVKAGKYVDVSGRCNIEYILLWERKSEVGFCCSLVSQSASEPVGL